MTAALQRLVTWARAHSFTMLVIASLLVIAGIRLSCIVRFTPATPVSDDWQFADFLESWANGDRNWGYLFERHNGAHLSAWSRFLPAFVVELNGVWDRRLESLMHLAVYLCYAVAAIWLFARVVPRHRGLMTALIVFVMAIPFAGGRVGWGFLSCFDFCGLFTLLAFAAAAWGRLSWKSLALAVLAALGACYSVGSGCMAASALAGMTAAEMIRRRRADAASVVWAVVGLAVFAGFYLTMKKTGSEPPFVLINSIKALFKSLAWPWVFVMPLCVLALVPAWMFVKAWWRMEEEERTSPAVRFLLLMWLWLGQQCLAIAFFRGENNNMGMPSMRYTDILIQMFFVQSATLLYLGRKRESVSGVFRGWLLVSSLGLVLNFVWRVWPFLARENGEYTAVIHQDAIGDYLHGEKQMVTTLNDSGNSDLVFDFIDDRLPSLLDEVKAGKRRTIPPGMFAGIPLEFGSALPQPGASPEMPLRPEVRYYGTNSAPKFNAATVSATSNPFTVQSPYLIFDIVVDKKAKFRNYSVPGVSLNLIPAGGGEPIAVLPKLGRQFPFLLRDRDTVAVKVQPGQSYTLEVKDAEDSWVAFAEPQEGGSCTGWTVPLLQSGKLFLFAGLALAGLALAVRGPKTVTA